MAYTYTSIVCNASNTTDLRAFGAWMHAAIVACGLVQTADTGQIDWTTVTAPGAVNTAYGYEIWRFDDALQGSYPVYMKFNFSTTNGANPFAFGIQCGTASDGAGNLTGTLGGKVISSTGSANAGVPQYCLISGTTSRLTMAFRIGGLNYGTMVFIERLKNIDGTDSSVGFAYGAWNPTNVILSGWTSNATQVYEFGTTPPALSTTGACLPAAWTTASTTTAWNNNLVLAPSLAIGSIMHNPLVSFLGYLNADVTVLANPTVNVYGTDRVYWALGPIGAGTPYAFSTNANSCFLVARF